MTKTETLLALAARVEAGETGRQLAIDISNALFHDCPADMWLVCLDAAQAGSLDAVAALTERVLPRKQWRIIILSDGETECECWYPQQKDSGVLWTRLHEANSSAPTERAARLAAILRAKAKDQTND